VTVEDQRSYIKIETLRGKKKLTEIHSALSEVCGELTVDRSTVSRWASRFRGGRVSINDDPRPGRPKRSTDERSVKLVHTTRCVAYCEIDYKKDGPKTPTALHGPLGKTYHQNEKANMIADCLENHFTSHDLVTSARFCRQCARKCMAM
jgi:hypothetical protein